MKRGAPNEAFCHVLTFLARVSLRYCASLLERSDTVSAEISVQSLTFGTVFSDYDLDGPAGQAFGKRHTPTTSAWSSPGKVFRDNNVLRLKTIAHDGSMTGKTRRSPVRATKAPGFQMVKTGSSCLSQSEMPLTFDPGKHDGAIKIEIALSSGRKGSIAEVTPNQLITVKKQKGVFSCYQLCSENGRPKSRQNQSTSRNPGSPKPSIEERPASHSIF